MNERRCPVCGEEQTEKTNACRNCGLDGLNQMFLSETAYLDWYEREVISRQDRIFNPRVFAGGNGHFLILLGSGDLYAVGNNYSGACGPDLPQELTKPVRIARNVKHAAAGKNHTVYITTDGEVKLIGNSDLSERFQCDIQTERVFSNGSDTFFIEAYNGAWYAFGDNSKERIAPRRLFRTNDRHREFLESISESINRTYERRRQEYEEIQERQIQVFCENRVIYEPVRCQERVSARGQRYPYFGPDGCPSEHRETVLGGYRKQYFGGVDYYRIVSLYEKGDILFLERWGGQGMHLTRSAIGNAVDFAWSADGDGIIVATRDGEILWGSYGDNNEDLRRFRICEYVNWRL